MSNARQFPQNDVLVLADDQTWIWNLLQNVLNDSKKHFVRLPSNVRIRHSWERFKQCQKIIICWENKLRSGGAIIEEILEVAPAFDIAENVLVLTTNPTHEDVVYFSELTARRILRLRNREQDLKKSAEEIHAFLNSQAKANPLELEWRRLLKVIDGLPKENPLEKEAALIERLEKRIQMIQEQEGPSARSLDAAGTMAMVRGKVPEAEKLLLESLEKNPNYYRAYRNITELYSMTGRHREAMALMQKMQALNTGNISRLVKMGELHATLGELPNAEHYFKSALDRDSFCSGALNGLAEIRFFQGDLDESRRLLARSNIAYKSAAKMNREGIELVRKEKYQAALEHYTRAQYVLPQQDKSALLFYNIALCYYRWGKPQMATEFLKIALVKEPQYKKAQKLLEEVKNKLRAA